MTTTNGAPPWRGGRAALALAGGLVTWVVVASVLQRVLAAPWPEYAVASKTLSFTLPMMLARLALGAVTTLAAGYVVARVAPVAAVPPKLPAALGVLLLLFFVPTHAMIWSKLPVWFHLTFLLSLLPLSVAGGRLASSGRRAVRDGTFVAKRA